MPKLSFQWCGTEFYAYIEDQWPHKQLDPKPKIKEQKGVTKKNAESTNIILMVTQELEGNDTRRLTPEIFSS